MQNGPWYNTTILSLLSDHNFEDYYKTVCKENYELLCDVNAYERMNPSGFYDASSGGVRPLPGGKFEVLEVDCWTRTPILADIGTFAVPLST